MALPKKRRKTLSLKDRGSSDATEDFPSFAPKVDNTLPEAPSNQEKKVAKAEKAEGKKPVKVYTDEQPDARFPVMGNRGGMLNAGRGSYVVKEGQEADGVVGLMRVPTDAIVFGGYLFGEDEEGAPVDVGGDIGWLDNAIDGEDLAGIKPLGEMQPKKFSAQTVIVAKCSAAPGTKVSVVALYVVD